MNYQPLIESSLGAEYQVIVLALTIVLSLVFFVSDIRIGLLAGLLLHAFAIPLLVGLGANYDILIKTGSVLIVMLAISLYYRPQGAIGT